MGQFVNIQYVINSLVFSAIGILVLILAFVIVDLLTPQYKLWKEIVEHKNLALAILVGSFAIGTAMIISSAIHG